NENTGENPKRYVADTGASAVPHLYLRQLPSGQRMWVVMRRPAGSTRPVIVTIGREDALKRRDARTLALEINAKLARGINPNAEKRATREAERAKHADAKAAKAYTFLSVGRSYIKRCAEGTRQRGPRSESTLKEYSRKLQSEDLAPWHTRPLAGIS